MTQPTTLTVQLSGQLSDFVQANIGEDGTYENPGEYIRDLIRKDRERVEHESAERLKAELANAFNAPDCSYHALTAAEIIARNQR